ncbi:unnamed protein product [Parascedosporium putredinis]|uniref:Cytochrome P450 n=1 Tax=Parascedosporium putredinis TaxID=1442378 RepID=A0A9P1GXX8_9PEZI|nr:unnamed protein product [Parascedosporium putredinis]CAI7991092.1 unnamed protein product [Parascedosporium putredinis]
MYNTVLAVVGAAVAVTYLALSYPKTPLRAAPGPAVIKTGIRKPWLWFHELTKEYGDVVYLQMGPTPTIILGSAQAAWDLLEKRGAIYSSRPRFVMGGELLSNGLRGLMAPYGPFWRRWRKLLHSGFMQRRSETYRPIQSLESKALMRDLLEDPADYRRHLERYAASVIVTVTYGRRVLDVRNDVVVKGNAESMERLTQVNIPGKYAVERYPALRHVPSYLAPWKAEVLAQRQKDIQLYTTLMNEVKAKSLGMTDLELAYTAGSPFGAGVETSAGSLASFLLACVKFGPQFIPKAQAELDRVVGPDRLPTFDDLNDLEYIRAITSETLRWRPVAVLGGTLTPAPLMTITVACSSPRAAPSLPLSVHLNEADYPNPHEFKPERFLEKREYPGPWGHSAFGWGRRVCPGMHLGSSSGEDIDVDMLTPSVNSFAYTDGFNSLPLPFSCDITPRSERHAQVIKKEYEASLDELQSYTVANNTLS